MNKSFFLATILGMSSALPGIQAQVQNPAASALPNPLPTAMELSLTDLDISRAVQMWGSPRRNQSVSRKPLRISTLR